MTVNGVPLKTWWPQPEPRARREWLAIALTVLLVGLAVIGAMLASGCASMRGDGVKRVETDEKMAAAVRVRGACGQGSGVIVAPDRILTARHVIACKVGPLEMIPDTSVLITLPGGTERRARVEVSLDVDIARLRVEGSLLGVEPRLGRVVPDARVCAATAYPMRGLSCGHVTRDEHDAIGGIAFTANVEPGNSGSGLYDEHGRLIGIVIWRRTDGRVGGMATALASRAWLVSP